MSKIKDALNFLKDDLKKAVEDQWQSGGKQFSSLLQREDVTLDDLLEKFDPSDDEQEWIGEYQDKKKSNKAQLYRKRIAFLKASRKEFYEEYDPNVTDVDFMRLLEIPYSDPKYVIDWSLDEMGD